jgi:hypothetical protein
VSFYVLTEAGEGQTRPVRYSYDSNIKQLVEEKSNLLNLREGSSASLEGRLGLPVRVPIIFRNFARAPC